jgi:hypothetical protein
MLQELKIILEPLGFAVGLDGTNTLITDPNGKAELFDPEDSYWLLKGLTYNPKELT